MPTAATYMQEIEPALSIKYNNRVYEMKQAGHDVIVLSLGEAFFDIPLFRFDDLPFPDLYHYSHSRGVPELRRRLAAYYAAQYGVPTDADRELIVTAGSKIAVHMAFMALLDVGDEVIIPEPAWVSYPEQVKLCRGVPVMVPVDASVADYARYVTARTRAIVINNPHNPRGAVLHREELETLYRIAREHDLYVIADEAYSDFVLDADEFISCGALDPSKAHTVLCNSMSKNYGMSGWRIGYMITNAALTEQLLKLQQHLLTCPATILEHYLARHFDEILDVTKPQIRAVVRKRQEVAAYLDELGLPQLPGSATFYLFVSIAESGLGSEEFCNRLLDEFAVSAVPGLGYGHSCDGYIRVAVGAESMERTREGLRAVRTLVGRTAGELAGRGA